MSVPGPLTVGFVDCLRGTWSKNPVGHRDGPRIKILEISPSFRVLIVKVHV